jgi:hypothetical protein
MQYPENPQYLVELSRALHNLSLVALVDDRRDEAEAYRREAQELHDRLPADVRDSSTLLGEQAAGLGVLAVDLAERGDAAGALKALYEGLDHLRRAAEKWPENPVVRDHLYDTYSSIADIALQRAQPAEAAAAVEQLVAAFSGEQRTFKEGAELLERCAAIAATPDEAAAFRQRKAELLAKVDVGDAPP